MSHRHMHQKAPKPRIPWQQYVVRFEAEKARQQQRYCDRFRVVAPMPDKTLPSAADMLRRCAELHGVGCTQATTTAAAAGAG